MSRRKDTQRNPLSRTVLLGEHPNPRGGRNPVKSKVDGLGKYDLKQVMFDRLHNLMSLGPPIDPRGDVPSYAWLVDEYRQGSDGLQQRMVSVANDFIHQLTNVRVWPEEARISLFDFVQECRMELDAIDLMIRQKALLRLPKAGPEAHAGLLKCLLDLGHKRSPVFWQNQLVLLGPDYGALIFGALAEHGLDEAMKYLSYCCKSDAAVAHICLYLPTLVDSFGLEEVQSAIERQRVSLPPDVGLQIHETMTTIAGLTAVSRRPSDSQQLGYSTRYAVAECGYSLGHPEVLRGDEVTKKALRATREVLRTTGLSERVISRHLGKEIT